MRIAAIVVGVVVGALIAAVARRRRAQHQAEARDRFSQRELVRRGWGPTR